MAQDSELQTAGRLLVIAVDRVIAAAGSLDAAALNWEPIPGASTLSALCLHVLGMTRENVLTHICRVAESHRVRAEEFSPSAETGESLAARWASLRPEVEGALGAQPPERLDDLRVHQTWGEVPARELLHRMVNHAYEHAGQAELTRQLLEAHRAG